MFVQSGKKRWWIDFWSRAAQCYIEYIGLVFGSIFITVTDYNILYFPLLFLAAFGWKIYTQIDLWNVNFSIKNMNLLGNYFVSVKFLIRKYCESCMLYSGNSKTINKSSEPPTFTYMTWRLNRSASPLWAKLIEFYYNFLFQ